MHQNNGQYKQRMLSLQTKNKKLKRLIELKVKNSLLITFEYLSLIYHLMY